MDSAVNEGTSEMAPAVRLAVTPTKKEIGLMRGERGEFELVVKNTGTVEMAFAVYAAPYNASGGNFDFETVTEGTAMAEWIKFYQEEYVLGAGETTAVRYYVEVPKDAAAGRQAAVIFAESGGDSGDGVQTISRVGSLVDAEIDAAVYVAPSDWGGFWVVFGGLVVVLGIFWVIFWGRRRRGRGRRG